MGGTLNVFRAAEEAGVKRVVVVMEHEAKGQPKLLRECNLPLTGQRVADLVITDLGVFTMTRRGEADMRLIELADGVTVSEIAAKTEARFTVALEGQAA